MKKPVIFLLILLGGLVLCSCQANSYEEIMLQNKDNEFTEISPAPMVTQQPTITDIPVFPSLMTSTVITPLEEKDSIDSNLVLSPTPAQITSPLANIELEELSEIISNPFDYAGNGKDEGHHGADFSFYHFKTIEKIENLPVYSITAGTVRSAITNRPPYGNMMIIETPLTSLPEFLANQIQVEYPESDLPFYTNLSCPKIQWDKPVNSAESLSLYILYAHLYSAPTEQIDAFIASGQKIGEVGNSGYSGNPHLHLEFRIGPSGNSFLNMAHYDNTATQDEIYNYCLWRVSGFFYQIDPAATIEFYLQNR